MKIAFVVYNNLTLLDFAGAYDPLTRLKTMGFVSEKTTVAALCGGSLLLGAAGMLKGKRATTHPQLAGFLKHFAGEVLPDRIVDEGNIITAGGVTAGIDLGLYLCERIAGRDVRETIAAQMDYTGYRVC